MLDTIWEGVKSVFVGGVKIVVGTLKTTWAVMKFAVKAAVWVVVGTFTILGHLAAYVRKTLSEFFIPEKIRVTPTKKLPDLVRFMQQEAEKDGIAEDPDVLEIISKTEDAANNHQVLIFAEGKDTTTGEVAVSDPVFISADSWDKKIEDANNNNQIYTKKIRLVSN